jgi:GH24 family phage-related lysozyme (muramidase)
MAQLRAELTRDEGRRKFPYYDQGNRMTVGVGHDLADNGLNDASIDFILGEDIYAAAAVLDHNIPWWRTLDPVRQRVMLNLSFAMGWPVFAQFARFFSAVNQHRWDDAAMELIASRWAVQVGDRARRLESMMRTGCPVA